MTKKVIQKRKRESWRLFCAELNKNSPIKEIRTGVRKLKNTYIEPMGRLSPGK